MVTLDRLLSAGATLLPSTRSKCRLASGTHTTHVRATVQTGQESDQRLTLGSCTRLDAGRHDGTRQVETVRVDETSFALRLLDAFHLTFTSGKHLFMLELHERVSVTTAQAHTCISPLGGRISLEWCIWWLQQHGSQQQGGQLFGVL